MIFDRFVQQGLGDGRIVDFTVPMTAITNQIDNHIAIELVAIFNRHAPYADDRIDIFAVDVKNRDILPARDSAPQTARNAIPRGTGGKPDQVVDDHVQGAADRITRQIGIVQHSARIPCPANAPSP